jgi:sugar/nucleoside kinase (ribokinase family)
VYEALVAGHVCLDIIPELRGDVAFEPGRLIEAGPATLSTGGAVSNTGQALTRLGVSTRLMGKIGDDLFGRAIKDILGDQGRGMVVTPGEPTSYTVVVNLTGRDRMFLHAPGCNNTFSAEDVPLEALEPARVMHFGYPPLMARMFADDGAELEALFRRAKDAGLTTSLDMSLPDVHAPSGRANWKKILERVLPHCDLFLPSIEELIFMLHRSDFDRIQGAMLAHVPDRVFSRVARESIDLGAKIVGIKAGSRGLYIRTPEELSGVGRAFLDAQQWENLEFWMPCFKVDVIGTTGAGDATIAGLLMGILGGLPPLEACTAAVAAGACCCERPDAVSGVRSWEETRQRMEAGWERRPAQLGPDWKPTASGAYTRKE